MASRRWNHRGHQLHDDRRGDIGHDAEGEDGKPLDGAAREHVHQAENALALLGKRRSQAGPGLMPGTGI